MTEDRDKDSRPLAHTTLSDYEENGRKEGMGLAVYKMATTLYT